MTLRTMFLLLLASLPLPPVWADQPEPKHHGGQLSSTGRTVVEFADNVLARGRDRWSGRNTPLFADGVHVDTWNPVEWHHREGRSIVCNFANQQNFLRTLVGLSNLTGDERYRQAARDATAYMLAHFQAPCGLLVWGEHAFVDLRTLATPNIEDYQPAIVMELSSVLPFYELMWEADPEATARFLRSYWNALLVDGQKLRVTRHTQFGRPMGRVWENPIDPDVPGFRGGWFAIWHLPDSVYAGAFAAQYGGDERALLWAQHLNGRMIGGRHPESGLDKLYVGRADQRDYAGPLRQTRDDDLCYANFAQEIYVNWRLAELAIAELLGDRGQEFRDGAVSGLKSYARHGYDAESNTFRFLKADGTPARERTTVPFTTSGPEGERESYRPDFPFLLSYARAWRMSKDPLLWQTARGIARGNGLGDIGSAAGQAAAVDVQTECHDPFALLAVLEIYRGSGNRQHLDLAHRIAENVVARLYVNGLFLDLVGQRHTRFSALAPLALLQLEAASRGVFDAVPSFIGGHRRGLWGWHGGQAGQARSGERTSDIRLYYSADSQ